MTRLMDENNSCEMTYSHPALRTVPVASAIKGFSLLEQAGVDGFNIGARPVLFVPGHSGRYAVSLYPLTKALLTVLHNDLKRHTDALPGLFHA